MWICIYTVQINSHLPSIFSYVSQYVLLQTHTNELCPKSLGTQGSATATDANEAIKMKTNGVHKSMLSLMFYCVICVTVVMLSQSWVCSIMIWCSCSGRQTRISFCQHVTWDMCDKSKFYSHLIIRCVYWIMFWSNQPE